MATDDDYIPYNGPYEEPPRRTQDQSRGSWGDQAYDDEANNVIHELHSRYVPQDPWLDQDGDRKSRPRARTHSGVSGQTVSSGAIDPHRASVGLLRKSASPAQKPPVPSYINLDASGGVGESPAPSARYSARETPTPPKRTSLASIFTFGQTNKRTPVSPSRVPLPTSPPAASPLSNAKYAHVFAIEPERSRSQPSSIYSGSSEHHPSTVSQEVDAYHSYYNFTPAANQFGQLSPPQNATPPPHPYSYGTPKPQISDPPPTAPLLTSPKLKFTAPASQRFVFPQSPPSNGRGPSLKNSASTPNLRKPPSLLSKGKDKWLSAETWCDAVLLPRPRLKVEDAQQILRGGSGRTVSPPGSPVLVDYTAPPDPSRPVGLPSRVLVHSRSMASLNQSDVSQPRSRREVPVVPPPPLAPTTQTPERGPRPKSFAWDDLALPSPVPSLARVLEEGQILEHQRKKWQMQATGSFQNTRTRSLSRARAKSLSRAAAGKPQQSSLNFLAARSLLGNQDVIPVLPARHMRAGSQGGGSQGHGTATFTTRSSQQHSHSNSLVKTMTKSSQGHSRSESWSRSAIKKAATICYPDGALSPAEERVNGLETALRRGDTKVIRLADPALLPADPSAALTVRYGGISPTPSGTSDGHMGIAISTPPPPATETSSLEREPLRLPSHPYAQNGTSASYSYHQASTSISKGGADYAGPHPAITVAHVEPQDVVTRHRLPPQAKTTAPTSMQHPYASKRDSYAAIQTQPRLDSNVPGPSKMWAQLAPGVVREILPDEIQYSPFMPNSGMMPPEGEEELESEADPEEQEQDDPQEVYIPTRKRKSTVTILDTVGLGETLAYAIEEEQKQHRDSGLGTSEEHAPDDDGQAVAIETHHPYRIQRKPVQYEFLNTPQTPKKSTIHTTHTAESSLVDPTVEHEHHRLTPPTPPLPSRSANDASPAGTSSGSSPARSPPHIGSVDDLDEFRDLFFKPNLTEEALNNLSRPSSERYPSVAWDSSSVARTQRTTGTGLTTLARQLSAEFSELRAMRRQIGSIGSDSSISRFSGFPRESDIQFIFTESEMGRSIMLDDAASGARPLPSENLSAFHATTRLPEDVQSSRASSIIEGSLEQDDENESFRVRSVESSTPAASPGENRSSFTGQLAFIEETTPPTEGVPIPRIPSLHPPSADPTRSSYMTNSTLSRISNLSDFPEPPPNSHPPHNLTPAHMSLLNSYFGGESVPEQSEEEQSAVSVPFTPRLGERF
uniref:Proteophosphoglycan ppg4 n=1 Tax=Mycena chlorophos TaxID=658473 RepID=A0ABQ0LDF1_MYCCL|nr:predicted protein [Mycena chlorophos]